MEMFIVTYRITRENRDAVVGRENAKKLFDKMIGEGADYARICSAVTNEDGVIVDGSVVEEYDVDAIAGVLEECFLDDEDFAEEVASDMRRYGYGN